MRPEVMAHFRDSLQRNWRLYELLGPMTRNFLTTETVIVIHDILIEEAGVGGMGLC